MLAQDENPAASLDEVLRLWTAIYGGRMRASGEVPGEQQDPAPWTPRKSPADGLIAGETPALERRTQETWKEGQVESASGMGEEKGLQRWGSRKARHRDKHLTSPNETYYGRFWFFLYTWKGPLWMILTLWTIMDDYGWYGSFCGLFFVFCEVPNFLLVYSSLYLPLSSVPKGRTKGEKSQDGSGLLPTPRHPGVSAIPSPVLLKAGKGRRTSRVMRVCFFQNFSKAAIFSMKI
ncbi:uncharacterized protein LOC131577678 [Poecile atricapillus]|uniref:uncharacterized protein LOC131577678 n=1 Tax=Poecile atricapillus TaxID=48891 RepID=UPI00273A15CC|nr:uncharacterized protein LOC131577678 [Poecile atricapillus]